MKIERLWRTLFGKVGFWEQAGYFGEPKSVKTLQELKFLLNTIIQHYNSNHNNERSLGLTPNQADSAFVAAIVAGLQKPEIYLTKFSI